MFARTLDCPTPQYRDVDFGWKRFACQFAAHCVTRRQTCTHSAHTRTHTYIIAVDNTFLFKWSDSSQFHASVQLSAVTEGPGHGAAASGYLCFWSPGAGVSISPAGAAHHVSSPPLSNPFSWSQQVTATAVTTLPDKEFNLRQSSKRSCDRCQLQRRFII